MLSYRHAFHAGNFADLLKHIVQIEILLYLRNKEKPFDYIDTHAGAGCYALDETMADKNKEYLNGIGHFMALSGQGEPNFQWSLEHSLSEPLLALLQQVNLCRERLNRENVYPGSPSIAMQLLRQQDKAWLFELHSTDYRLLKQTVGRNRQVYVRQEDGFQGLLGLLPCQSRRALVLIDPPYEMKDDYQKVVNMTVKAHKKMPNTVFAIWYPVVDRDRIDQIKSAFIASGILSIQQYELGVRADAPGFGMTSAGMIVINPPWILMSKMQALLPKLAEKVSLDLGMHFKCEQWVSE